MKLFLLSAGALLPTLDGVSEHEQYHWLEASSQLFPTKLIQQIELQYKTDHPYIYENPAR